MSRIVILGAGESGAGAAVLAKKEGFDVFYVFDCLSELQTAWATDLMMGNFFRVTCPFLFTLDTVAFFPIIRGKHSFHAVKNLTTAEGGALTWRSIPGVDDEDIYKQIMLYSLHGQSKDALAKTKLGAWEYDIKGTYYKCNMTDIMASIGLVQLKRYPGLLKRRRDIIERYTQGIAAD